MKAFQASDTEKEIFEFLAKYENCNFEKSPYPDSFRTYKFDRTQHILEGFLIAMKFVKQSNSDSTLNKGETP